MAYRFFTHCAGLFAGSLTAVAIASVAHADDADLAAARNPSQYNLASGVGLKGYDPVSYFPEGGGLPAVGAVQISETLGGVTYRFASEANHQLFRSQPAKYEPTYGGWCAYAMASGAKVDIQPGLFTLHGNRLHLFVSRRAKQSFDEAAATYERDADQQWKMISGEEPRL